MQSVYSNNTVSSKRFTQLSDRYDDTNKYISAKSSYNNIIYSSTIEYLKVIHRLFTRNDMEIPFDMNKVSPFDLNDVVNLDLPIGNITLTEDENNQIIKNRNAIKEGKSRRYENVEEYLKSLDEHE